MAPRLRLMYGRIYFQSNNKKKKTASRRYGSQSICDGEGRHFRISRRNLRYSSTNVSVSRKVFLPDALVLLMNCRMEGNCSGNNRS
ncbi:hypothetical protein DERP_011175 [Dermatophagoides pteronyssinus]|uniref:Uncharacterized protein n=1 Tax=Dermatophagoides pteronyssinus TaxID=6956 RepID=A0ABQ8JCC8_DERPT|nr:hypothetical protein DERP_011175 [Dermatophagoides pteronyssinus]